MRIDVIIPVYYTYNLLEKQVESWLNTKGDWRLLICDNTPKEHRSEIKINPELEDRFKIFIRENDGEDGQKHGDLIDFLLQKTTSEIVCIQDCDFFWTDPDLLSYILRFFKAGYRCVGTEIYYEAYTKIDDIYPERHSSISPCIFGMFIERKLALEQTFVVTNDEIKQKKETGWRLRERLVRDRIKTHIFPCIKHPLQLLPKNIVQISQIDTPWLYVGNHGYIGFHLFGSTSYNREYAHVQLEYISTWIDQYRTGYRKYHVEKEAEVEKEA